MKKLSIRAIALVLCLAMVAGYIVLPDAPAAKAETATTTNPNLVENGTFETTLADGTVQVNKTGWNGVAGDASIVAEEGNEKNYVARMVDNKADNSKYIYYEVPVEPGATYTFKVDHKGTFTASGPSLYVRAGSQTSSGTTLHIKTNIVTTETWATYEVQVDIPAGETKAFILLSKTNI